MPETLPISAFVTGLVLSATLIVAIGAQNTFVLQQGLRRQHVPQIVGFCIAADALLLTTGIVGLGHALGESRLLSLVLTLGGALFLLSYGIRSFRSAVRSRALDIEGEASRLPLRAALTQVACFTFLNPHVYLDTVLLIGSVGAKQPGLARLWFLAGALAASILWFCALGFGARFLRPWFARPVAWKILDASVGVMMVTLAVSLGIKGFAAVTWTAPAA